MFTDTDTDTKESSGRGGVGWAMLPLSLTHHGEAVTDPQTGPSARAGRDLQRLAVYGDNVGWHVTHDAPRDKRHNVPLSHRHHRYWRVGGQPIGSVVAAGVVADVVEVAEEERHRAEPRQARPRPACRRNMVKGWGYISQAQRSAKHPMQ